MNIAPNDSDNAIVSELQSRIKELEYDCAELVRNNDELSDRVKKLASRQPSWPKGYRQQYRPRFNNKKSQ